MCIAAAEVCIFSAQAAEGKCGDCAPYVRVCAWVVASRPGICSAVKREYLPGR